MLNKAELIGRLGQDPDIRTMQSGSKVANLSIATTETWKKDGQKQEKTEWHKVSIFNEGIVRTCESYLCKGCLVYIEGALQTRSWEQDGQKKYTTEIVLRPYNGTLKILEFKDKVEEPKAAEPAPLDPLEDDIPF